MDASHYKVRALLLVALSCALLSTSQTQAAGKKDREVDQQRDTAALALVCLISEHLPEFKGVRTYKPDEGYWSWDVWYQPQYGLIRVRRNQAVFMSIDGDFPNPPPDEKPDEPPWQFPEFSLRVEPYMSPAVHARLQAENKVISKRMEQMREQMGHIGHMFDSYSPSNDAEKKQVDAYERVKATYHSQLPDFYFRDISLSWFDPTCFFCGEKPWESQMEVDDEIKGWPREQADAIRETLKLLTPYHP